MFTCASRWQLRQATSDLAYDARVAFVCAFGSTSEYQALIDDTQRMLAREKATLIFTSKANATGNCSPSALPRPLV